MATVLVITVDRDARAMEARAQNYVPEGSATVQLGPDQQGASTVQRVLSAVETVLPEARSTVIEAWVQVPGPEATAVPGLGIPEGRVCPAYVGQGSQLTECQFAEDRSCGKNWGTWVWHVAVGGADELAALVRAEPSDTALTALASGGVVALDEMLVENGSIDLQIWDYEAENYPDTGSDPDTSEYLPAVVETPPGGFGVRYPAIISPETAARIGYPVEPVDVLIDVDGGITAVQESTLNRALVTVDGVWLWVVRSSQGDDYARQIMYGVLAAVLLVAGLSTALALGLARADARRDDFTLAALGASPRLAPSAAAWQAAIIVAVSLGVSPASGIVVGWVEHHGNVGATFSPPWLMLGAALIAVPVMVGALAWLFTRAPQAVHYRLAA